MCCRVLPAGPTLLGHQARTCCFTSISSSTSAVPTGSAVGSQGSSALEVQSFYWKCGLFLPQAGQWLVS